MKNLPLNLGEAWHARAQAAATELQAAEKAPACSSRSMVGA